MIPIEAVKKHIHSKLKKLRDPKLEIKERIFAATCLWYYMDKYLAHLLEENKSLIQQIYDTTSKVVTELEREKRLHEMKKILLDQCQEILREIQPPFTP